MIKFIGDSRENKGHKLVGLGISEGNVIKLKEGKPILVKLNEMIPDCNIDVLIFYGKTEQELYMLIRPELEDSIKINTYKEQQ